jgi:hypothetical protein
MNGITQFSGPFVQFTDTGWFSPSQNGSNQAARGIHVRNASKDPPNQATIVTVFNKVKSALQSEANSGHSLCSTWVQTAPTMIDLLLTGGDPSNPVNLFGHGTFDIETVAAFTYGRNPDNSPTGIPSDFSIAVNDGGAFFQSTASNGGGFRVGRRNYAGNTLRAHATILIHELAHNLQHANAGAVGFQSDLGIPKAGKSNDELVDKNCRALIEGIQ